jgi:hypothetical protein
MRRAALLAALALLAACPASDAPFARGKRLESLDQAPGGQNGQARVGDFLLENDQVRAVIEQGGISVLPTDVGGTLIDLDLNRPQGLLRSGRGLDQLGQIAPIANLNVAHATTSTAVRLTRNARGAEVTVAAESDVVFKILTALALLVDRRFAALPISINLYTEYELRPGERMLRVRTTAGFNVPFCPVTPDDGCNPECDDALYDHDCKCPSIPARCQQGAGHQDATLLPDRDPANLLDILLGDMPRGSGGTCSKDQDCNVAANEKCVKVTTSLGGDLAVCRGPDARDAGVFFGDLLVLGAHLTPWVRGIGYDTETDIRRLFDTNQDTLSQPLVVDAIYATGDRLSLGYAAPGGKILVPIFRGPFSLGTTHSATCPTKNRGCLEGQLVAFERWISVGTGDVASAQEPLLTAAATATGTVRGRVTEDPSGAPRSHVDVYALRDPRSLTCDDACKAACPAAPASVDSWTLDDLRAQNRCRTHERQYPEGTSAIESVARTDPGTDPILDGNFELHLAPGAYFLVAVDGQRGRSRPLPVSVSASATSVVDLALPEQAQLRYVLYDETGKPGPGKITIGHLPGKPCASDDACGAGTVCLAGACNTPWTPLVPLEFGGKRPVDGNQQIEYTTSGTGSLKLPPGEYDVLFSRGPHYSVDRQHVTLAPRVDTQVTAYVRKVVDRKGWIGAGFHVHSGNSVDSGEDMGDRVAGYVAEDMDLLSSADHDYITQYGPLLEQLGLKPRLSSMAGIEITTQEYGHYIAFPLLNQAWQDGVRLPGNDAPQWRGHFPQEIIDLARTRASGDLPVMIDMPHPYDYFDFYRIDPVSLEPITSLLVLLNPFLDPTAFTGDFDVMELANTKNFHRVRRATVSELQFYERGLDGLIADLNAKKIDQTTFERRWLQVAAEATRRRLHRTVAEQEAALAGTGDDVACLCGGDGSCAAGQMCDPATLTCMPPPGSGKPLPSPDALCRLSRGVVDDWFNMLNRGVYRTGVSGADEHDKESAFVRTLVRTDGTTPPYLKPEDIIDGLRRGHAIVTNGPMVHFTIDGAQIGDTLSVGASPEVHLHVRVEKASWYDVDRIEIYRNGHLIQWANGCDTGQRGAQDADPDPNPCITEGDAVLAWDQTLTDHPDRDSWYAVLVYGLDGRTLAPVYESQILAEINTPEITRRLFQIIPGLQVFKYPREPSIFPVFPMAFTNPIWVDVNGDGWTPPASAPSWCRKGDIGCHK